MQPIVEQIRQFAMAMYDPTQMKILATLIVADVILALAVSLFKAQNFNFGLLADFLRTRIAPYFMAYTAVKLVVIASPELDFGVSVIWGLIVAAEVGRIIGHIGELGLPVPDVLKTPTK
jgi:hypothetical protein